ncbi:hypothetical protein AD998_21500 [bacterium 336/3]|nr:hypothetical protein AD998_21500 [bacterium 336/3]
MIQKELINIDWINQVAKSNQNADKILVEKVIHALLLLEGLAQIKMEFVFKGGTSLMLLFNSTKRLSIDIDIIVENTYENLDEILETVVKQQGFNRMELQNRSHLSNIEKAHYKFFYTPFHKTAKEEEYILLDILFEKIAYSKIMDTPIVSTFIPTTEQATLVKVPCFEDLLGDKLTAFAPHTTGIPYYKGENSMSMEIIKQLYDIGNLFDVCIDLEIVRKTFKNFAKTELIYRNAQHQTENDVLDDIFQTALCITSRGILGKGDFEELQLGIKRITGFIFSETYHIDKVIVSASKVAYLSVLLVSNTTIFGKFENPLQMKDWLIENPEYNKLNKLKKSNPEAFFYWFKTIDLIDKM